MRESSKSSLCGVISALAVVIMLTTYLSPFLVYTAPAFAGLLLLVIINELGIKWGIGTYFCISMLSFFIISDKEASVFFTLFFGYFPILVFSLEKTNLRSGLKYLIEILIFNISCVTAVFACYYFFGISLEDFNSGDILYNAAFIVLMNVLFFVYTNLIKKLQLLYMRKFRKFFRKMFNIK